MRIGIPVPQRPTATQVRRIAKRSGVPVEARSSQDGRQHFLVCEDTEFASVRVAYLISDQMARKAAGVLGLSVIPESVAADHDHEAPFRFACAESLTVSA